MKEEELMKVKGAVETYGPAPEIDLSKIKNTKAAKVGDEFAEKIKISEKKMKKNKFCFTEEYSVNLPSNGIPYRAFGDEIMASGKLTIRPMSLADEEILGNKNYINNGTAFLKVLENCIVEDINVKKLIPYDVFFLLYYLRKITYGEDYKFEVTCPNCGKKYEKQINISDVEWEEIEDDNAEGIKTIKLPVSKFTVVIETTTLGNEEEVSRLLKTKGYDDYGENVLTYVARTREILDDKGEPVNPRDYADFFNVLPGRDRTEITKAFEKIEELLIPMVDLVCPKCEAEDKASIPFTKEFFRY